MQAYSLNSIKIKNEKISYYIQDNQAKDTILFIHGYNSSSDFAKELFHLKHNFNLIVLNLPGSLLLPKPTQILSLDLFKEIVNQFISKHVKTKNLILLGHSLGGGTISSLSQHPKVKQVIYLSTIHPRMNLSNSWKELYDFYYKPKSNNYLNEYLNNNFELEEIFDQTTLFNDLTKKYLLNLNYVNGILKDNYTKSLNKQPLFIIGSDDYVIETKYFIDFVKKDLNQEVIVLNKVKHSPIKEQPELINQILNQTIKFQRRWWPLKLVKN